MKDFDFINPTRIIFGKDKEVEVGNIIASYGYSKVLLVYGEGSIKKNGLYQRVIDSLRSTRVDFVECGGVSPNPDREFSVKGREFARAFGAEMILAVGGGSVIDSAKSIAVSYFYSGDPFDFNAHKKTPKKALPIGVILTISSSGSESSDSCVISDRRSGLKQGFNSNLVRPLFAIEDPVLTFGVSPYQTAAGVVDIMMHSMERYFASSGPYDLADDWALALIRNVKEVGLVVMQKPNDYDARASLMIDSSLSHDGLTGIGKGAKFVVHPLEHALSGYRPNITHGAGIGVVYLGWARYVYQKDLAKFARLARKVFDIKVEDDEKAAIMGVNAMKEFYESIGMPTSFKELGLSESDIPALSNLASGNGTRVVGLCPQPLEKKDIEAVYRLCL